jgi:hypothetical protein
MTGMTTANAEKNPEDEDEPCEGGPTMRRPVMFLRAAACVLQPHVAPGPGVDGSPSWNRQGRTGRRPPGAVVRVSSPSLIGGLAILTTNEKGQLRLMSR